MNSVLQCLLNTTILRQYFVAQGSFKSEKDNQITESLLEFTKLMTVDANKLDWDEFEFEREATLDKLHETFGQKH